LRNDEPADDGKPERPARLAARADLALRSYAPSKRLVLENLVIQLCEEPKVVPTEWQQEELPV